MRRPSFLGDLFAPALTLWSLIWLVVILVALVGCAGRVEIRYQCASGAWVTSQTACPRPTQSELEARRRQHAREALAAGDTLFELGNFRRALAWYAQAYALEPRPEVLYRAAQSARLGGHGREALWLFRVFLARTVGEEPMLVFRNTAERWVRSLSTGAPVPEDAALVWEPSKGLVPAASVCEVRALELIPEIVGAYKVEMVK